jgi:hypothetical protein
VGRILSRPFFWFLIEELLAANIESAGFESDDIEITRHRLYSNERLALRLIPEILGIRSGPFDAKRSIYSENYWP